MGDPVSRLREAFASGSAVVVAGAGVASALSGGVPASTWIGLIESGIAEFEVLGGDASKAALIRSMIAVSKDSADPDSLIFAASIVANGIKAKGDHAYARWLEATVGGLVVADPSVALALGALRAPLLTTNYDTLLEAALRRDSACWNDPAGLRFAMANKDSTSIGHLHGIWKVPDSVILTVDDYHRLEADGAAQALQRATATLKSVVYVGFGSGLQDPNLGQLIRWSSGTFAAGSLKHYRLCRNDDLADLRRESVGTDIEVVSYGADYSDLPSFLERLAPPTTVALSSAGLVRDLTAEAQRMLEVSLVEDSIIAEATPGKRTLEAVTIRPQLLQVPYASYAKALRSKKNLANEALRPEAAESAACDGGLIVVCGADESGLTTTIKMMALAAARHHGDVAPLYVSFRQCQKGPQFLQRQVAIAARAAGLAVDYDVPSHPYVLALDDLNANVDKVSDRVIEALPPKGAVSVIVGCKEGREEEVVERLKAMGRSPRLRYLRAMTREDVTAMAVALRPSAWETLTDEAIKVLRAENLPNTPLSVALLLSVLARGSQLAQSATQTSILDEYVSDLLGRGDPHEDARFGTDQRTREALLSAYAEYLVTHGLSGATEVEATAALGDAIKKFGWSESPGEQLRGLINRHVLRRSGEHIVFSRHSYLYLFAAKRAEKNKEFAEYIRLRPLYYSSILRDQAALTRSDLELLTQILPLLEDRRTPQPVLLSAFDEVGAIDGDPFTDPPAPDKPQQLSTEVEARDPGIIDLFGFGDDERPVFPSDDPVDMPYGAQLARSVELVSAVLRDSDQIEDIALKRSALVECLDTWGFLVRTLEADDDFGEFAKALGEALWDATEGDDADDQRADVIEFFARLMPSMMLLGGVATALASRRLLEPFRQALEGGALVADQTVAAGALGFTYAVRERGWPKQARALLAGTGKAWFVSRFLLALWIDDFEHDRDHDSDQADLLELCVEIRTDSQGFASHADRIKFADRYRHYMLERRVRARARSAGARERTLVPPAIGAGAVAR